MIEFVEMSQKEFELYDIAYKTFNSQDIKKYFYSTLCIICEQSKHIKKRLTHNRKIFKCIIINNNSFNDKRIVLVCTRCHKKLKKELLFNNNDVEQKIIQILTQTQNLYHKCFRKTIFYFNKLTVITNEEHNKGSENV